MRKFVTVCLTLLLISIIVLSGCESEVTSEIPITTTFTDQAGRTISFTSPPEKIVSLAPSNTEILYALGLESKVVGVTDYCNYPPEVSNKPTIGGYWTPDLETIIALTPDLVVTQSLHQAEIIPKLEQHGIKCIVLEPMTVEEVLDAITLVGNITGQTDEAATLVSSLQTRVEKITSITQNMTDAERPGVFYLTWHDPLITVGSPNIGDDLIVNAGGKNIFSTLSGSPQVQLEDIVHANPDIIIAGVGMGTGGDVPLDFMQQEPTLAGIKARQNNAVFSISIDISGRTGPRIVDALEDFAAFIHPELFK